MSETKKPKGRPIIPEGDRKSINFTFRGRPELHEQLRATATLANRSLSEEIEQRLVNSFSDLPHIEVELIDKRFHEVLLRLSQAMQTTAQACLMMSPASSTRWLDNRYAFDQAVQAATRLLMAITPEGDGTPPRMGVAGDLDLNQVWANMGNAVVGGILHEIASEQPTSSLIERGPRSRRELGEDIVQRIRKFIRWKS